MKNLWPKFEDLDDIVTPKEILEKQGDYLRQLTKGILTGNIITNQSKKFKEIGSTERVDTFIHVFNIYSLTLDYNYTILNIEHETIKIFPSTLQSELIKEAIICNSQIELETSLEKIFNSSNAITLIKSLYVQSKNQEKKQIVDDDLPF